MSFFGCQFDSFQLRLVCAIQSSCDTLFGSCENKCAVFLFKSKSRSNSKIRTKANYPVSLVGRSGGQGQSLISLAKCLRGNFGPSGKWAASAPSKGWERTHIANSSCPRTFKRPGAGVAIRAPATQTLPPVAGEGKLPTAIPIFQPWSRCHRDYVGWLFLYKHRTLMLAYAMAAAPEWALTDLPLLLEYHEYVISKALETDRVKRPQLRSIIQADHETRGRWMLYLRQNSDKSLSDAVMYHRSQSAFLWTGIHNASVAMNVAGRSSRPRSKSRRRSRTRRQKREQRSKRDKGDAFRLETRTQKGETICTFFNKGKCVKGAQCPMAHVCNYPGCFSSTHARVQQHPVRPPQPR